MSGHWEPLTIAAPEFLEFGLCVPLGWVHLLPLYLLQAVSGAEAPFVAPGACCFASGAGKAAHPASGLQLLGEMRQIRTSSSGSGLESAFLGQRQA